MVSIDGDLGPDDVRSELVTCEHHHKHFFLYGSIVQLCIVEGSTRIVNGPEDFVPSLA